MKSCYWNKLRKDDIDKTFWMIEWGENKYPRTLRACINELKVGEGASCVCGIWIINNIIHIPSRQKFTFKEAHRFLKLSEL
jgi:hypothetical protein